MWHVGTGTQETELKFGKGDAVFAMGIAAGGRMLAVGGKSSCIVIYSIRPLGPDALNEEDSVNAITEIGRFTPTGSTPEVGSNTVLSAHIR